MLSLVHPSKIDPENPLLSLKDLEIDEGLFAAYIQSHKVRGHSEETILKHKRTLSAWFKMAGNHQRPLSIREALHPVTGRQWVKHYSKALVDSGLTTPTIRAYLLVIYQYCEFILDHPFVEIGGVNYDLKRLYGDLKQPVSKFDLPTHAHDREVPLPMDPALLYEWLAFLRQYYLSSAREKLNRHVQARNYSMIVFAAETGLRIDELTHLSMNDLFFDSFRVQTRHAKGASGSGKRSRTTLFPPLSRATMKHYLQHHRTELPGSKKSKRLFPSVKSGILSSRSSGRIMRQVVVKSKERGFPVEEHLNGHGLRRIFATRFIEAFPDKLPILLNLLGHSNFATVHRYIKHSEAFMDQEILAIVKKVDEWPSNGP